MTKQSEFENLSANFKKKKYVIVDSVMSSKKCKTLTAHLLDLVEQKKTVKDSQCPLSESIYGDPVLDSLLEDLRPILEKATGLKLLPTYSYARKYVPGDELKPHLDRAACEISATLTLGFEGKVWPIHVSKDDKVENDLGEILVPVGSMVVYRGMEINHWREKYTQGKWQCQVFLHYVDANGPHKDLKFDNRKSLGEKPVLSGNTDQTTNTEGKVVPWYFGIPQESKFLFLNKGDVLSERDINQIIEYGQGRLFPASIGDSMSGTLVDKNIRNVNNCWLPTDRFAWLYQMLEKEIRDMNWLNYRYALQFMENINYLEYHASADDVPDEHGHGKYSAHIDGSINSTRKLSFSILLSDPSEYEGGDLLIYENLNTPHIVEKKKGSMTFFPSNIIHEVTPVTKGIRRSIVSWIHGPHFM